MERRHFLTTAGVAAVLAGCSGTTQEQDESPATQTDRPSDLGRTDTQTSPTATDQPPTQPGIAFEHPDEVLPDKPFDMKISGLPAGETVEVRLGDSGTTRSTTAVIETDAEGQLDLKNPSYVGGDVPEGTNIPLPVALHQFGDTSYDRRKLPGSKTARYRVSVDDRDLGSTTVTRHHPSSDMLVELDRDELVGEVFEPADSQSGPGVILLHGSSSTPLRYRAGLLARNGFTALALKYVGGPGLPERYAGVPLEYLKTAINWLSEYDTVTSNQIGLLGLSKGGELALLAGSLFDKVGSVVSISGSGVVWQGINARTSSWSLNGEPVPYVPFVNEGWSESLRRGYTNSYEAAGESEITKATIPVEQIPKSVLLVSGTSDEIIDAARFHNIAEERLAEHDHPSFTHLVYDNAGHDIVPPYRPLPVETYAGSEPADATASHDHWPQALETLSAVL